MKHVVSLTLTSSAGNFETIIDFFGQPIRVSHYGADFDLKVLKGLIEQFDGKCDVIALTGLPAPIKIKGETLAHRATTQIQSWIKESPLTDGQRFRNTYIPWVIREYAKTDPHALHKRRFAFHSGVVHRPLVSILSEYSDRLVFADPYFFYGIPRILEGVENLDRFALRYRGVLERLTLKKKERHFFQNKGPLALAVKPFIDSEIFVSTATVLERFDLQHLRGKTLLVDHLSDGMERKLKEIGVFEVLHFFPDIPAITQESRLTFPILEALFMCHKDSREPVSPDDILRWIVDYNLKPQIHSLNQQRFETPRKFAFVIHPLSLADLFRHPLLRPLKTVASNLEKPFERLTSHLPGVKYGEIRGIRSISTGQEAEGLIYTLFSTPKMMKNQDPEDVYRQLVQISKDAASRGADIMGLGAYTKIVGDAGVTVANRASIPVTTGNSLSASATLWAARVACEKLGFLPPFRFGGTIPGSAMIIGATGSIGAVSAKLLSQVFEHVIIVSPRPDKLLELKTEMEDLGAVSKISIAVNPDKYSSLCDLIVVTTSSIDEKVLDIEKVKPGSVICDVSRPLVVSEEESRKRPDVLVIESGEVELPGRVHLNCDIGLQESVVYACLAETALLALEGRMESFTLSRNISYQKVQEIYDLARKHGARLAKIRGPQGEITDQEIDLCREHALEALKSWSPTGLSHP